MPILRILLCLVGASTALGAQRPDSSRIVELAGEYVESYFAKAQSIVAEETVVLQPLGRDLLSVGFPRRLVHELRLDWNPSPAPGVPPATIVRELVSATGPPLGPPDQPDCLDPRAVSPEPLAFLLPETRDRFRFDIQGTTRVDGRAAVAIDYTPRAPEAPIVVWTEQCAQVDLPGRVRGRVWVDPSTGAILRFDERLVGPVDIPAPKDRRPFSPDWFTFERADTTYQYKPVRFADPDETLLMPSRVEGVAVVTNSGMPRLRITQSFANYRRFVTESRIIP